MFLELFKTIIYNTPSSFKKKIDYTKICDNSIKLKITCGGEKKTNKLQFIHKIKYSSRRIMEIGQLNIFYSINNVRGNIIIFQIIIYYTAVVIPLLLDSNLKFRC